MNLLAILIVSVMTLAGIPAPSHDHPVTHERQASATASASLPLSFEEIAADESVELVDAVELESELAEQGLELMSVDDSDGVVDLEIASTLGNGSPASTDLSLDYNEASAVLTIEAGGGQESGQFSLEIQELNDNEISFVITDLASGQAEHVSSLEGGGAVAVVLGIPIALAALEALLAAALVILVAGVTYIAASEAIRAIQRANTGYNHYVAIISGSSLFLGSGLSYQQAWQRVQTDRNTWSTSQSGARSVCQQASGGRNPVGPEIDRMGSGKFYHFHRSTRSSAHCFYGLGRP